MNLNDFKCSYTFDAWIFHFYLSLAPNWMLLISTPVRNKRIISKISKCVISFYLSYYLKSGTDVSKRKKKKRSRMWICQWLIWLSHFDWFVCQRLSPKKLWWCNRNHHSAITGKYDIKRISKSYCTKVNDSRRQCQT